MKQHLFFPLFLLAVAGFNPNIYAQKSREIALGYTGIGLDNTFSRCCRCGILSKVVLA